MENKVYVFTNKSKLMFCQPSILKKFPSSRQNGKLSRMQFKKWNVEFVIEEFEIYLYVCIFQP